MSCWWLSWTLFWSSFSFLLRQLLRVRCSYLNPLFRSWSWSSLLLFRIFPVLIAIFISSISLASTLFWQINLHYLSLFLIYLLLYFLKLVQQKFGRISYDLNYCFHRSLRLIYFKQERTLCYPLMSKFKT